MSWERAFAHVSTERFTVLEPQYPPVNRFWAT